jgi:hypothetical protein
MSKSMNTKLTSDIKDAYEAAKTAAKLFNDTYNQPDEGYIGNAWTIIYFGRHRKLKNIFKELKLIDDPVNIYGTGYIVKWNIPKRRPIQAAHYNQGLEKSFANELAMQLKEKGLSSLPVLFYPYIV